MPRGYRFLAFAAVFGLAAWCFSTGYYLATLNYPQQERYESYRYASDKLLEIDSAALGKDSSEPFEYREPCNHPKGRDESDLCAQWKAVRASESSALWAQASFWLGIAGTIGLIVTLWFNYRLLRFTQDSGKDAEAALKLAARNAASVERQVEVAESSTSRTLRAYVNVSKATVKGFALGEEPTVKVEYTNSGQTPAKMVKISRSFSIMDVDYTGKYRKFIRRTRQIATIRSTDIPPKHTAVIEFGTGYKVDEHIDAGIKAHKCTFLICGIISYSDVFGKRRRTLYFHYLPFWRSDLTQEHLVFGSCDRANRST